MNSIHVLLVEDSPSDAELTAEAFNDAKIKLTIDHVTDGVEAMKFLRRQQKYSSAARPSLILLDLNLPRKDGWAVLEDLKSDSDLMSIPVVVLTTSKRIEDIDEAYRRHANCYVTKPVDMDSFVDIVKQINHFWFSIVKRPCD
ncbi:MAG: response regulator [Candidatus Obscuribacterales bacterium]|nr:response regulator [Candidatus Obscuribacterales bacterium]